MNIWWYFKKTFESEIQKLKIQMNKTQGEMKRVDWINFKNERKRQKLF